LAVTRPYAARRTLPILDFPLLPVFQFVKARRQSFQMPDQYRCDLHRARGCIVCRLLNFLDEPSWVFE
jgi:hypothetical protein